MLLNLTDKQKEILRWFVEETRNGNLAEEFNITWTMNGYLIVNYSGDTDDVSINITKGTLNVLASEGLLVFEPHYGKNGRESSRTCTLTPKARDIVDSNFELSEQHPAIEIGNIIGGDVGGDAIGRDKAGGDIVGRDKLEIEKQINYIINTRSPIGLDVPCLKIKRELSANTISAKKGIQFTDEKPEESDDGRSPLLYIQIYFKETNLFAKHAASEDQKWLYIEANMRPAFNLRIQVQALHMRDVKGLIDFLRIRKDKDGWILFGPRPGPNQDGHYFYVWREDGQNRLMMSTFTQTGARFSIHARFTDDVANEFADYLEEVGFTEPFKDEKESND